MDINALSPIQVSLADKVAFLGSAGAYGAGAGRPDRRETHMSWVFLTGDTVYKLKKPVRLPYLDFSTRERRRLACVAELALNRRLAPDVYRAVVPLVAAPDGRLAIGGPGEAIDWLVVMRRLDESGTLEHALLAGSRAVRRLDPLIATLVDFYRKAGRIRIMPDALLADWRMNVRENRRVLLDPRLGLPAGLVFRLDRAQRRFLRDHADLIRDRARRRCLVDGHGDLRPEHIWPGPPVHIIDCLEFNTRLRSLDPLDEIAFLVVECERLGGALQGEYIRRRLTPHLPGGFSRMLFDFYRCYRATLRARLAIAHLLEPAPRTPHKWPRLALSYLSLAAQAAHGLADPPGLADARP